MLFMLALCKVFVVLPEEKDCCTKYYSHYIAVFSNIHKHFLLYSGCKKSRNLQIRVLKRKEKY